MTWASGRGVVGAPVPGIQNDLLTFRSQGRDYGLTDIHGNEVKALQG